MNLLIYLLLLLSPILAHANTPGKKSDRKINEKQTFIVMTYNIRMNTPGDGENAWPLRKERVAGLLRFHKADLFGVQEALPEQVEYMAAAFPEFGYVGVGRDDGISQGEHMNIFYRKSRFDKLADGNFWLSPTPDKPGMGWDAACNRTCTWIKLKDKMSGKTFFMFNTHLDHRGDTARLEGSRLILEKMTEINRQNLPFILTGDFNSVKTGQPIQTILKVLKDSREICVTTPYGPEGTSGGFDVKLMPRIIDYIFVNDRVKILRHGILTDSWGLFYPSDHLPVLAEVAL